MWRSRACHVGPWTPLRSSRLFGGHNGHNVKQQMTKPAESCKKCSTPSRRLESVERGLKPSLCLLLSDSATESARGERLQTLSALIPQLSGRAGETDETLDLK